jgi:hypothetical protein
MRMLRAYWAASMVACEQALAAIALAVASTVILVIGKSGPSVRGTLDRLEPDPAGPWLDMLFRLTVADLAALGLILIVSLKSIQRNMHDIRTAVRGLGRRMPSKSFERMTALSAFAALVCVIGLFAMPPWLTEFANRDALHASLIFLWPTVLTVPLAFFAAVFIGAFEADRSGSQ